MKPLLPTRHFLFRQWVLLLFLAGLAPTVSADYKKALLKDLNLNDGADWELVGVSLYNSRLHPLQEELKTWIIRNPAVLDSLQRKWVFRPMYEDWCDWHYALKFYRNRKVQKTLKVNLICGYITDGYLSYEFSPELLEELQGYMRKINWSGITYYNLDNLRYATRKFRAAEDVYLYTDINPYLHDGFFVIGIDSLYWRVNRDSVRSEVEQKIKLFTNREDFYLEPRFVFLSEDYNRIHLRFNVYCSRDFYDTYRRLAGISDITAHWRDHFHYQNPNQQDTRKVRIVVVNMTRERYVRMMNSD